MIQIEVFFSIYGYDQQGQPMKVPSAGGSRLLKIHRPVVVPSVSTNSELISAQALSGILATPSEIAGADSSVY